MSAQDTLSEAYDQAFKVFDINGLNTDDVDEAFNIANSWTESALDLWAATEDTLNIDDASTKYGNLQVKRFFTELIVLYNERYDIPEGDKVQKYLDAALFGSSMDAQNAYDQRIQNDQVLDAVNETIDDVKKAAKFSVMPILLIGGLIVFLGRK